MYRHNAADRTGASHFCRVALIPQPLLPRREKGGRIKVPLPPWEGDLGGGVHNWDTPDRTF